MVDKPDYIHLSCVGRIEALESANDVNVMVAWNLSVEKWWFLETQNILPA